MGVMEDDMMMNKDDLGCVRCVEDDRNEEASILIRDILPCAVIPDTGECHPPPPQRSVDDMCTLPPDLRDQERSLYIDNVVSDIAVPKDIGTRADNLDSDNVCNGLKDDITVVRSLRCDSQWCQPNETDEDEERHRQEENTCQEEGEESGRQEDTEDSATCWYY